MHHSGARRGQSAFARAGDTSTGVRRRGQLRALPAALQLLEPGSRQPRTGARGAGEVRSLDQLFHPGGHGTGGAACGGETGAKAVAEMDESGMKAGNEETGNKGTGNEGIRERSKKPSRFRLGFGDLGGTRYGVTNWVEWLPCGIEAIAAGLACLDGNGVAWAGLRLPALGSRRNPETELPSRFAV